MILPLPRTGPSSRCKLQFTTKIRLSRPSRAATEIAPSDSGSSTSPSPMKAPNFAAGRVGDPAIVQILEEARLIDGLNRPQAHRDRRELPEVRHQPRVRIRRKPFAVDFLTEVRELLFADAAFQKGARVHARRRVPLEEDEVAAERLARCAEKMIEADVVERRRGCEAGDVAAQLRRCLVGLDHHRHRVPTDVVADARLELFVARNLRLLRGRNRVDVRRLNAELDVRASGLGALDDAFDELLGAARAFVHEHAVERLEPILRFLRVGIDRTRRHAVHFIRCGRVPHARMGPLRSLERSKRRTRGSFCAP